MAPLALLTAGLFWRGEQVAKYEAAARLSGFRDDLGTARLLLGARAADMDQLGEGREAARRALDRYRADADARLREQASVRRLPEEEKDRLQAEIGELLVLLATPALNADGRTADDPKRRDDLDEALRMNRLAEKCYPEGQAPRALWAERGRLEALLGHKDECGASTNGPTRRRCATTGMNICWPGSRRGAAGWRTRRSGCGRSPSRSRPTSPCSS